jgi:hypothetical protein
MFNGGARKGAGRPLSPSRILWLSFALEEIVVKQRSHGQVRLVKKSRLILALEKLFEIGMRGDGDVRALSKWLDHTIGKPEREKIFRLPRDRNYSPSIQSDNTSLGPSILN